MTFEFIKFRSIKQHYESCFWLEARHHEWTPVLGVGQVDSIMWNGVCGKLGDLFLEQRMISFRQWSLCRWTGPGSQSFWFFKKSQKSVFFKMCIVFWYFVLLCCVFWNRVSLYNSPGFKQQSSCLSLLSARITGVCYQHPPPNFLIFKCFKLKS
jgi:hypothetical protein